MSKKRILIVDYEPKSLERVRELIPDDQYEVCTARDGLQALEEYDRFKPQLVFLRTMLPKKHGFQVCQEIIERSGSHPVPVLMHCSIYKSRKYKTDAIKVYGASDYLEDPIEKSTMDEILARYLGDSPVASTSPGDRGSSATGSGEFRLPDISFPDAPPATPKPKSKSVDMNKMLEDTLSGISGGAKKKEAAPAPPPPTIPPPLPPVPEPAKPGPTPPETPKQATAPEGQVTSEELFGDVLNQVMDGPAPKQAEPSPKAEAPRPPAPKPATGLDSLGLEPLGVKKPKAKMGGALDKKLEDTLSGFSMGAKKREPASPAPPKAEEPKPAPPPPPPPPPPKAEEPKPAPPPPPPLPPPKEEPKPAVPPPPPKAPETKPAETREAAKVTEEGIAYGKYTLIEKIAVGGMAELFKAKQKGAEGFEKIVAIKRILSHLAANSDFVTMFIDEAKLAAQLNHPNVAHIYDLGKLEDSYFIAMEYVEGRDLRTVLRECEERGMVMPPRVALLIAQKVCSALQAAHTAKDSNKKPMDLVHRDVSPQNILLSTSGEVKLVDFGIAKAASKASHTQTGALKGKLLYMSPEQAWGKSIDARTDIFSLGTVLFEMLTGKKLFLGDSEMSILERVREAKVTPPRSVRPEIPEGLERILLKSLQKDPSARFRDCRAMEEELERFSYQEWTSLPTSYEALEFLNDLFPEVYKKDAIKALKPAEAEPETMKMAARKDLASPKPAEEPPAEEPAPAKGGKPPKYQRGKPAPVPPREKPEPSKDEAPAPKKEEPKPAPPPPKPAPPPPKVESPPKPKAAEPPAPGSAMFGEMAEEAEGGGKKKGLLIGLVAVVVVAVIAVVGFFVMGKKGPAPETNAPDANAPAANAVTNAPPPPVVMPEPVKPVEGAPAATEAEIKAARGKATEATKAMAKAIADAEQAGAAQYAGPSLEALKTSEKTIMASFRRAKNPPEFDAVTQASQQVVAQAGTVKTQTEQAKSAAAAADEARRTQEAEAAKKKADEDAKKKADDAKKAQDAQQAQQATKRGDFVESWALDVKPKPQKEIKADYTSMARQNRVQGRVTLEVSVDETGKATTAQVLKGLSPDYGIHDALVRAAMATSFSPGMKDGQPVKTKYVVNLNYTMK